MKTARLGRASARPVDVAPETLALNQARANRRAGGLGRAGGVSPLSWSEHLRPGTTTPHEKDRGQPRSPKPPSSAVFPKIITYTRDVATIGCGCLSCAVCVTVGAGTTRARWGWSLNRCSRSAQGCVLYPYGVYPLLLWIRGRSQTVHGPRSTVHDRPTVSVVLAAYNEAATIGRRLREFTGQLAASGLRGEVVVVSDGSTDQTAAAAACAAEDAHGRSRPKNRGKAAALSAGAAADGEIIVFADARQTWAPTPSRLVENFDDPAIGAVGGELVIESKPGSWPASGCTGGSRPGCGVAKGPGTRLLASAGRSARCVGRCSGRSRRGRSSTTFTGRFRW